MGVTGTHTFLFEASKETPGGTTFVQKEEFEGLLSVVMHPWLMGRSLLLGYEGFNRDLKKKVEGM